MEIDIVRRPRRIRRRRDVVLAVVASTTVLAAVIVAVQAPDPTRSPDRQPGLAIGVDVPDAPPAAVAAVALPSTEDEPTGVSGPTGTVERPAASAGPSGESGAQSAAPPANGAVPGVTAYDDGSTTDQIRDPIQPAAADGPLTGVVDPVLRGLGSTASALAPVVEPVRQVTRSLTGCLDDITLLLSKQEVAGCQ